MRKRLGVMCSGNGTNFENIVKSCWDHEVVLMIYNTVDCGAMQRATKYGIIKKPNDFPCPIINVHPSLLPKYKGLHAVEQAIHSKDKITGCTVHYVNNELDGGEIIQQAEVPIFDTDNTEILTKRIQREEYRILPEVIKKLP